MLVSRRTLQFQVGKQLVFGAHGAAPQALQLGATAGLVRAFVQALVKGRVGIFVVASKPHGLLGDNVVGGQQVIGGSHDTVFGTVEAGNVPVLPCPEQLHDLFFVGFDGRVNRQAGLPTKGTVVVLQQPLCCLMMREPARRKVCEAKCERIHPL